MRRPAARPGLDILSCPCAVSRRSVALLGVNARFEAEKNAGAIRPEIWRLQIAACELPLRRARQILQRVKTTSAGLALGRLSGASIGPKTIVRVDAPENAAAHVRTVWVRLDFDKHLLRPKAPASLANRHGIHRFRHVKPPSVAVMLSPLPEWLASRPRWPTELCRHSC